MSLLITKAKPNPIGKDRIGRTYTPPVQLAAEWVDFQNNGTRAVDLAGVEMYHLAYLQNGSVEWELVIDFIGMLQPQGIVRVHSGDPISLDQMNPEDRNGADFHLFTHKDYIWNNKKVDKPSLWYKPRKEWLDQTEYSAPVTEGKILKRVNDKLV